MDSLIFYASNSCPDFLDSRQNPSQRPHVQERHVGHPNSVSMTNILGHRVHHIDSRLLSRLRRAVGRFDTELLGVLGVEPLPAAKLHGLGANHAADGSSAEKVIQNIETNVPPGSRS